MPFRQTYDFECPDCAVTTELKFTLSEYLERTDEAVICPKCNGVMRRKLSAPNVVFKGQGWVDKKGSDND